METKQPNLFDTLPPKTAFVVGIVGAVLCLGTLGFIILGGCVLTGSCSGLGGGSAPAAARALSVPTDAVAAGDPVPSGSLPDITADEYVRGNKDAAITLVEYSDFECPFCGQFHTTLQQVARDYPNDVKIIFRHFPLSFHPEAEPAALAAECAGEQGKFWEFHDIIFENQTQLGDAFYTQTASQLGLNAGKFKDCVSSQKYLSKIQTQSQEGGAAGVTGTPGSFLIGPDGNVVAIKGAQPYSVVKSSIDQMLAK